MSVSRADESEGNDKGYSMLEPESAHEGFARSEDKDRARAKARGVSRADEREEMCEHGFVREHAAHPAAGLEHCRVCDGPVADEREGLPTYGTAEYWRVTAEALGVEVVRYREALEQAEKNASHWWARHQEEIERGLRYREALEQIASEANISGVSRKIARDALKDCR